MYQFEVAEMGDRTESLVCDEDVDSEKPFWLDWALSVEQGYPLSGE